MESPYLVSQIRNVHSTSHDLKVKKLVPAKAFVGEREKVVELLVDTCISCNVMSKFMCKITGWE